MRRSLGAALGAPRCAHVTDSVRGRGCGAGPGPGPGPDHDHRRLGRPGLQWRLDLAIPPVADVDGLGVPFDLVGPHDDLFDVATYEFGSQAYADPAFDRDHAARWGMALAFPDVSMTELMTDYQPDVVIETRGYNDLTWLQGQPSDVLAAMADEVAAARVVDPSVEFVLGQLPQVWQPNVSTFDAELPVFAAAQSQPGSRVVAAATGSGFVEGVDTWDLAHYAATGEVKFAAGIADALAGLGVGNGAGAPPTVVNGHWGDATLAVAPGRARRRALSWCAPPGAREEVRVVAGPDELHGLGAAAGARWWAASWEAGGLAPGHRYEFRLQAAQGVRRSVDGFSNVVGVARAADSADSWRRGWRCAPTSLAVTPGVNRLTVGWAAVPTASSYDVTWASDVPGDGGARNVSGGPVVLAGLVGGRQYRGLRPGAQRRRRSGSGCGRDRRCPPCPPPRAGPGEWLARPGSHRLDLSWAPAPGATSYDVTWTGRKLGMRGSAERHRPRRRDPLRARRGAVRRHGDPPQRHRGPVPWPGVSARPRRTGVPAAPRGLRAARVGAAPGDAASGDPGRACHVVRRGGATRRCVLEAWCGRGTTSTTITVRPVPAAPPRSECDPGTSWSRRLVARRTDPDALGGNSGSAADMSRYARRRGGDRG